MDIGPEDMNIEHSEVSPLLIDKSKITSAHIAPELLEMKYDENDMPVTTPEDREDVCRHFQIERISFSGETVSSLARCIIEVQTAKEFWGPNWEKEMNREERLWEYSELAEARHSVWQRHYAEKHGEKGTFNGVKSEIIGDVIPPPDKNE